MVSKVLSALIFKHQGGLGENFLIQHGFGVVETGFERKMFQKSL